MTVARKSFPASFAGMPPSLPSMTAGSGIRRLCRAGRRAARRSVNALAGAIRPVWPPICPPRLAEAIRHSLLAPRQAAAAAPGVNGLPGLRLRSGRRSPAACAVEMVHTYSLIHDDLPAMDDDDLRRGRPSCHAAFGEATAILAGDALLAQAFEVLATRHRAAGSRGPLLRRAGPGRRGLRTSSAGRRTTCAAEFAELGLRTTGAIHRRKTGALIRVSLRLGGIVGQADDRGSSPPRHLRRAARPGVSDRR